MTAAAEDRPGSLDGLAGRLRAARMATSPLISQTMAARAIRASQNKISRAERGEHLLTAAQVTSLARLYGLSDGEVEQLAGWAEALAPARVDSRLILQRGGMLFQRRVRLAEEASRVVRSYQPALVLGVLQTEAYARVIFGGDRAAVAERLKRNAMMLREPCRQWVLIQTEGALRWNLGGPAVMREQIEHLIDVTRWPNVRLGIIAQATPASFAVNHGFHCYDENAVCVGTHTASTLTGARHELTAYAAAFERLQALATFGEPARALLRAVASSY